MALAAVLSGLEDLHGGVDLRIEKTISVALAALLATKCGAPCDPHGHKLLISGLASSERRLGPSFWQPLTELANLPTKPAST